MPIRICDVCGAKFHARTTGKRCSEKCRMTARLRIDKDYRRQKPQVRAAINHRHYVRHRDQVSEKNKAGREKYRGRYDSSEYTRRYRERHPEAHRAARARRRYQAGSSMTAADRRASVQRRKDIRDDPCLYCGRREPEMHDDHVIPLARGGTDHADNLVRACPACNLSKGALTGEEFIAKLASTTEGRV